MKIVAHIALKAKAFSLFPFMARKFGFPYEQNLQGDYLYSTIYPNHLYMYFLYVQ